MILGLAVCAGFFSMKIFPALGLAGISDIFLKLFQTVQYGNRFLSVSVLFLSCIGGYLVLAVKDQHRWMLTGLLCGITIFQSMLIFEGYVAERQILEPVDLGYSLLNIGNGEYVPEGTDLSALDKALKYDESAIQIEQVENQYLTYKMNVNNLEDTEQTISFPVLYYDGYRCRDLASKEELETYAGVNNRVTVIIPAGYSGALQVRFEENGYWKIAETVSALSLIVGICAIIWYNRKEKIRNCVPQA